MKIQEGELEFDFAEAPVWKPDEQGKCIPCGMCFVDFVVEEETEKRLIEVKDFSNVPECKYESRLKEMVDEKLVPKCRDTYTYLHLMQDDDKPFLYIVLIAGEVYKPEPSFLLYLRERLLKRLRQEAAEPWKRQYVRDCMVVSLEIWNQKIPYKASRLS